MKNLTWQNPEQLFVAQELINKVKSKCCGIKGKLKDFFYFGIEYPFLCANFMDLLSLGDMMDRMSVFKTDTAPMR